MAITVSNISTTTGAVASGTVNSVTSSVGNLSIVVVVEENSSSTISSVADNKGNTYYLAVMHIESRLGPTEIWYAPNATTGITTITLNFSAGLAIATFYDCSGAALNPLVCSDFIESNATGSSTTNPVGPTVNYNVGGGLVVSTISFSNTTVSVASPFTLDYSLAGVGGMAHYAYSTAGVFAPSWTLVLAESWAGSSALFASSTGTDNIRFSKGKSYLGLSTISSNPLITAVGDLVILTFPVDSSSGSNPIFSDNKGNTFTNISTMSPYTGGGGFDYAAYCILTTAGTNHIFTYNTTSLSYGPILALVITPSSTPTFNANGVGFTSSSVTNYTNASCSPTSTDFLVSFVEGFGGLESSWAAGASWLLGPFELDGNSYQDPTACAYQLSAVGGSTTDNFTVSPTASKSIGELIFSFTIPGGGPATAIYPSDMTPGTNVVFEIG